MVRTGLVFLSIMIGINACATSSDSQGADEAIPIPEGTRATLTYAFDGDSIEVEIGGRTEEIRLIGVNAPEGDECFGERARDALVAYLEGEELVVVADSGDDMDRFGRLLRYVYVGGENVNGRLLADGNAVTLQGDHRFNKAFVEIGNLAADAGHGMWADDACGPMPAPGMSIVEVRHNPPGPDDEHLNDEYVMIANAGETVTDLTGWTLRDESSLNRYVFGAVSLAPAAGVTVRTGCGTNRSGTLYWCADRPVWSNTGDTVILQDAYGNVAARWNYQ